MTCQKYTVGVKAEAIGPWLQSPTSPSSAYGYGHVAISGSLLKDGMVWVTPIQGFDMRSQHLAAKKKLNVACNFNSQCDNPM